MTRVEALQELMYDWRSERRSIASWKRVRRACRALDLMEHETRAILTRLNYLDDDGNEQHWLAVKLAVQRAKENAPG